MQTLAVGAGGGPAVLHEEVEMARRRVADPADAHRERGRDHRGAELRAVCRVMLYYI